jgi:hypothetical protein
VVSGFSAPGTPAPRGQQSDGRRPISVQYELVAASEFCKKAF